MADYKLSSDPNNCVGFIQTYPDKIAKLESQRARMRPVQERDELYNRESCALFLNLSVSTLDRMVKSEQIPFIKIGSRIVFSRVSLLEWLRVKELMPADYIEALLEREQNLIVEKRQTRIREVAGQLSQILEMQMDEKYWWNQLNSKKRAKLQQLEKKLGSELELLNYEEREEQKKGK